MDKTIISSTKAPAAIGTYSQAVKVGDTVYLSGQIGLDPTSMQMVDGIDAQIVRVFENLKAVAEAAGVSCDPKWDHLLVTHEVYDKLIETVKQARAQRPTSGGAR